jgi:hypothetical protein
MMCTKRKPSPISTVSKYSTALTLHLTTLPAEIRNNIYKHVLYHPGGLVVWTDPAGIRRICRQPLRQRGLLVYTFSVGRGSSKIGFNQLKYVSRLFYLETCGLECYHSVIRRRRWAKHTKNWVFINQNNITVFEYKHHSSMMAQKPSSSARRLRTVTRQAFLSASRLWQGLRRSWLTCTGWCTWHWCNVSG